MTLTKAKYIGIGFIVLFALIQAAIIAIIPVKLFKPDLDILSIENLLYAVNFIFPTVVLIALYRAKDLGKEVIYNKDIDTEEVTFTLLHTSLIPVIIIGFVQGLIYVYTDESTLYTPVLDEFLVFVLTMIISSILYLILLIPNTLSSQLLIAVLRQFKLKR